MEHKPRIVVVGGGYAGVLATLRAESRAQGRADVMLVSADAALTERIRLHEHLARGRPVRHAIARLLRGTRARFVHGRVESLDARARELSVDGERVAFDRVILALGSAIDRVRVPGVSEHAFTIDGHGIEALRARIEGVAKRGGRVVVCGAGLTGIEVASEIAEAYPALSVTLVTSGEVGEAVGDRGRAYLRAALARLGVAVREGVAVRGVTADSVATSDGELPCDVCIWSGGFAASPLLARFGLATNARGQALVDPRLKALGHDNVYVAGDAASFVVNPGHAVAMTCKTAMPMGAHAAENAVAEVTGRDARPFDFRDGGYCISLGRRDGLIQATDPQGSPSGVIYTGRLGAFLKELVCRYTVASLAAERAGVLRYRWLKTGSAPAALPGAVVPA